MYNTCQTQNGVTLTHTHIYTLGMGGELQPFSKYFHKTSSLQKIWKIQKSTIDEKQTKNIYNLIKDSLSSGLSLYSLHLGFYTKLIVYEVTGLLFLYYRMNIFHALCSSKSPFLMTTLTIMTSFKTFMEYNSKIAKSY